MFRDIRLPKEVGIEIVRGCNFQCRMCPVTVHTNSITFMDLELLHMIAEKLKDELSIRAVWLFNFGEPLLHPHFREILELLCRYDVFRNANVIMHTNASLLEGDRADAILDIPLINKLVFSFDGDGDKDSYTALRGNHYDRVLDNIRVFAQKAREKRPDLMMATCTILPKEKLSSTEKLTQIFAPLSVNVEVREMHDYSGNEKLLLSGERKSVGGGCMFVEQNSLYINVYGMAAPCCAVYDEAFYTASIITSEATEILNCKEWLETRHKLRLDKRKRLPFCQNCSLSIRGNSSGAFAREYWKNRVDNGEITDRKEVRYIKRQILHSEDC